MSFARYPAYKDSGVEWLGDVPGHWEVKSLKHLVSMRSGEQITSDDIEETGEYAVLGGNGHRGFTRNFTHEGDYALIGRQGALCGNINYATGRFWASEHAVVVTPRQQCKVLWLGELLRTMNLGQYSITAAQPGLSVEAIGNLRIPVPPFEEQQAIATFLDIETAKIDGLMTEQRALVALLKEKRQAVISHAVTKGLNPAAPMKDSGVAWLGAVPGHWDIVQLKLFVDIQNGSDHKHIEQDDGYPVLGSGGVFAYAADFLHDGESVLLGRKGTIDKPLHVTGRFWTVDTMYWTKISPSVSGRFTYYTALTIPFNYYSTSTALPSMTKSALGSHLVGRPPIADQIAIAAFLDNQTSQLDTLTQEAQTAIALLQERRTALISAAVTGKMDVRGGCGGVTI